MLAVGKYGVKDTEHTAAALLLLVIPTGTLPWSLAEDLLDGVRTGPTNVSGLLTASFVV